MDRRRTIRNYGITRDEFEAMVRDQDGRCGICGQAFDGTPHIDHCHASAEVRGLLCRSCNIGLGLFEDDVERLEAAVRYLRLARSG